MKRKKIALVGLMFIILLTTGCTKILKDSDKKIVKNPVTDQSIVENILCKPTDEKVLEIYAKEKIQIKSLPSCTSFKIVDEYEGIWTNLFVRPLAWLILKLGSIFKSYGFSIIIVTLLLRILMMPITKKTALQSENMKKAQPELKKLEKKYENKTSQEEMMSKSQEMLALYKKHDISMFSSVIIAFLQIPLFFAFYEAMSRLPVIYEEVFLNIFNLGMSPLKALSNGDFHYLIFAILVIGVTYFSFKSTAAASPTGDGEDASKKMALFMTIIIAITSFTLSTGIALYWIVNSGFAVVQSLITKKLNKDKEDKPTIIKTAPAYKTKKEVSK